MRYLLRLARRLRACESGGLISAEYLLLGTLLTLGLLVGVSSVQEAILAQLDALATLITP